MRMSRPAAVAVTAGALLALLAAPLAADASPVGSEPAGRPGTGLALPAPQRTWHSFAASSAPADLPDSVDLTRWAVAPGDQGSINSCVSWTLAYTIAGYYAERMGTPTRLAPMYVYSQTHLTDSVDGGGSYVDDGVTVMREQGAATATGYRPQGDYDFTTPPTAAQRSEAASYRTLGATRLFASPTGGAGASATASIKAALADGSPVGLGLPVHPAFYSLDATRFDFPLASATGTIDGYHYLAVLGYDRSGVWVENSWGAGWGRNGFAHLGWDFVEADAIEAERVDGFAASTLPAVAPPPSPSPSVRSTPRPSTTPGPVRTAAPSPVPSVVTFPPAPSPRPTRSAPAPVVTRRPIPAPSPSPIPAPAPHVTTGATSLRLTLPGAWRPSASRDVVVRLRHSGAEWTPLHGRSIRRSAAHLRPGTSYRLQVLVRESGSSRVVLDRTVRTDRNPLGRLRVQATRTGAAVRWHVERDAAVHVQRYVLRVLRGKTVVRVVRGPRTTATAPSLRVSRLPAGRYRFQLVAVVDADERPALSVSRLVHRPSSASR